MNQITATVIADSQFQNHRLTTLILEYPRFIHSEFMTHRVFSRNASSSRAIPVRTMLWQVIRNPAMPIHWGKNQSGMQAKEELDTAAKFIARTLWRTAGVMAAGIAGLMTLAGLHKQVANRILEPWQIMKVAVSATEWDNFFELRDHEDAQPEIQTLAKKIRQAMANSTPRVLSEGEWHIPYNEEIPAEITNIKDRKRISVSALAQTSYRRTNLSLSAANRIWDKLVNSRPIHASPLEHVAQAVSGPVKGNFQGFAQLRHMITD